MITSALKPSGAMRLQRIFIILSLLVSCVPFAAPVTGAPIAPPVTSRSFQQNPDWLSADLASRLNLSFDVLIPGFIPSPLVGEPDLTVSDGFYSLYWMLPGAPPTFLQVTGELGGQIPDYSKADRNVQLVQNADVAGYPAYHDLTPIYDLVYWQIGDVVYSVESRNLDGVDSISIANGLVPLSSSEGGGEQQQPSDLATISLPGSVDAGSVVEIGINGVDGATLTADEGFFTETGDVALYGVTSSTVTWQAPSPGEDTSVLFVLSDPESGDWITTANTVVVAGTQTAQLALVCPATAIAGEDLEFTLSGSGYAVVDAGGGEFPVGLPNSDFAADFSGGATMVGTVPVSGQVSLVWTAPAVNEPQVVYLFASNDAGETPGECAIDVQVSAGARAASLETTAEGEVQAASIGEQQTATEESSRNQTVEGEQASVLRQDDAAPTATKKPSTKPTKTPKPYDEVQGIPPPGDQGTSANGATSQTPGKTPSARPTATYAPTLLDDGTVASVIGPEGGSLTCPRGVTVTVPPGALSAPSTVTIQPLANTKIPVTNGVELISNTAFDITIAGADGRAIDELGAPAEIRMKLDADAVDAGARLYRVEGSSLVPIANMRIEGDELVVSVTNFARIVAGNPVPVSATAGRNVLPFILAAIVVIIAMIVMVVLASMFRPRRQRVITNRRPTRARHR